MKVAYSKDELLHEVSVLKGTFDLVRVIDPISMTEYISANSTSGDLEEKYEACTHKESQDLGASCICRDGLINKSRYTKFEFAEQEIYHILAKYIQVDGTDYVMELISKIENDVFLNAYGVNDFVDRVTTYNQSLYNDELTQVYNRKYLNEKGPFILKQDTSKRKNLGLAIIDIDNLKQINDQFGHLVGDKVIIAVANLLKSNISSRRGDFVVRFGGDEFIVMFRNIKPHTLINRLQLFVTRAQELVFKETQNIQLSLSIGGAFSYELENPQIDKLIELADKRLYKAKSEGKNCYRV